MALEKKLNSAGQKAYQRDDKEDRSLPYRNWMRTFDANGFFTDVDFIKVKNENGEVRFTAITEITRCDGDTAGDKYREAIIDRYFVRDAQGGVMERLGELLNVPVYLVLFQKEIKWLWIYSFAKKKWKEFTPTEWIEYLREL